MRLVYISLILLNISFVRASDKNENFDDQKLQQMLNDENLDVDMSSPVIEQDSLDVTTSDQVTDALFSNRLIILERQVQNLQNQVEDLKHHLKKIASLEHSFNSTSEEKNFKDVHSSQMSVFDSRPALKSYEQAQKFLENQEYAEAEKTLKDIINHYPEDPLVINAKYWLGETYFLQKKYKQAVQHFANAYEIYHTMAKKDDLKKQKIFKMSFAKAPEALVKLAHCLQLLEKKKQACLTLAQLQTEFPHATQTIKKSAEKLEDDLQCKNNLVELN